MSATPASEAIRTIAREDVRAVFNHIAETCDLPPMPAAAARALRLARDPDTTTDALAKAQAADKAAPGGGDAFIAGLLHDVGRLIFHLGDPKAYAQLRLFDSAKETELFGATHDVVGACVADVWELDGAIVEAILGHHGANASPLAAIVG